MVITNGMFLNGLQCGLLSQWWSEYIEEEGVIRNPEPFHKDNYLIHGQNAQTNGILMAFSSSSLKKQVLSAWVPLIYLLSYPFPKSWPDSVTVGY